MALTILEALKTRQGLNARERYLLNEFATASDLVAAIPFRNIPGNSYAYNVMEVLPGVGFRGYNESYQESTGIINPQTETLKIAGGDLDVDTAIIKTEGEGARNLQEQGKVQALALSVARNFIKGDSIADPRTFDGLQVRLTGSQVVEATSGTVANGGNALSLAQLDLAISRVKNPTHIIMNDTLIRALTAAARTTSIGGYLNFQMSDFGKMLPSYGSIPILDPGYDNLGQQILGFTETASTGATATATSVYVVSLRSDGVSGIQNGDIDVRDLGEIQSKPAYRTRVEWLMGMTVLHGRAACRIRGISDTTITA